MGSKKSKPVKQDLCPCCAEPTHHNDKTDRRAQGQQCYVFGRINLLSIACKHPIPNWRERTKSLLVPDRGRPYSSNHKRQVPIY